MPLAERIDAVAKDVRTRKDQFRKISGEALANALDVPLDDLEGDNWTSWCWYCYVKKRTLQKYITDWGNLDQMIQRIETRVAPKRFQTLMKGCERLTTAKMLRLLTAGERRLLCRLYAMQEANCFEGDGGYMALAYFDVQPTSGKNLTFEATFFEPIIRVESAIIRGPYDERDGKFRMLKNCFGKLVNDETFWETDAAGRKKWFKHSEVDAD